MKQTKKLMKCCLTSFAAIGIISVITFLVFFIAVELIYPTVKMSCETLFILALIAYVLLMTVLLTVIYLKSKKRLTAKLKISDTMFWIGFVIIPFAVCITAVLVGILLCGMLNLSVKSGTPQMSIYYCISAFFSVIYMLFPAYGYLFVYGGIASLVSRLKEKMSANNKGGEANADCC